MQNDIISKFAIEITNNSAKNHDPVIGRHDEIRQIIQILLRRNKCNPILIGEPGIGKTAIIYGLAQAVMNKSVPHVLQDSRIFMIDFASVIAGAKFKGEFEERLKSIIDEAVRSNGKIILFIDEIHMITTKGNDGSLDAANILKHSLARGEIRCIGATTFDEYREHIEKDQALTRRFQPIKVSEPNRNETLAILRGLREKYELHHGVTIMDNAIIAAVRLSGVYIRDRMQPDKAIDLIDEGAAFVRMTYDSKPEELQKIEEQVLEMNIELKSLKKDHDKNENSENIIKLEKKLQQTQDELKDKNAEWNRIRKAWQEIRLAKTELESAKQEYETCKRSGNLGRASELIYDIIPKLQIKLDGSEKYEYGLVTRESIAQVVSRWTKIPLTRLMESERDMLNNLEKHISHDIIGQEHAIMEVSNAIRRSKAGIQDENKPIGSFLFVGNTGVGKTQLAKTIAKTVFLEEDAITCIDMSEYMEGHSVSKLIGSPPGYIGYNQGNGLAERVRRRPYQLILLDEIEKAHIDVLNILLQIMDEGRLTDSTGKVVNFSNTVIVMTSNIGHHHYSDIFDEDVRQNILDDVRSYFRPEFLNRMDAIIIFRNLNNAHIAQIAKIQIDKLIDRVKENRYINLVCNPSIYDFMSSKINTLEYGARELNRIIAQFLEYPLAAFILQSNVQFGDSILIGIKESAIVFQHKSKTSIKG